MFHLDYERLCWHLISLSLVSVHESMLWSTKTNIHYMRCCYCNLPLVFLAHIVKSAFKRYLVYVAELLAAHDNRRHLALHNYWNASQRVSNHWLLQVQKVPVQKPLHKPITSARTQVSLPDADLLLYCVYITVSSTQPIPLLVSYLKNNLMSKKRHIVGIFVPMIL